jgi:hypothetical protein
MATATAVVHVTAPAGASTAPTAVATVHVTSTGRTPQASAVVHVSTSGVTATATAVVHVTAPTSGTYRYIDGRVVSTSWYRWDGTTVHPVTT